MIWEVVVVSAVFLVIAGLNAFELIWLLTSPPDKTGPHIHALARISRLMTIDKFRIALAGAKTPQEVYDTIVAQENAM